MSCRRSAPRWNGSSNRIYLEFPIVFAGRRSSDAILSPRLGDSAVPEEFIFREKAREAIRSGKLPSRRPDRTWGGTGAGAPCPVCGEIVTKDQLEIEVEFDRDGSNPGVGDFHIHVRCFAAWELERC